MDQEKWNQLKQSLFSARLWVGFPVLFMLVGSHWIRAMRWRLLIEPLGYKPSTLTAFFAVMTGYLVNLGVPRLGEIIKCTLLARYEKIPADKLIGTIILERLIDALCLLLVFILTLAVQPELYQSIVDTFFPTKAGAAESNGSTLLFIILLALVTVIILAGWMRWKKKTSKDIMQLVKQILGRVMAGISTIRHLKKRKQFVVLTLLLWSLYLYAGYLGFLTFQETSAFGHKEALTILSAGSIGMIASPGGIGAYAYLVQKTMQLYGLNYTSALAFGWLLWVAQTVVILVVGLFSFIAIPFFNTGKKRDDIG
jgi:uncharacterized protein (TIRG00374 family)